MPVLEVQSQGERSPLSATALTPMHPESLFSSLPVHPSCSLTSAGITLQTECCPGGDPD